MPPTTVAARQKIEEILNGDATFATTLLILCVDMYGTEFLNWHPETILTEIAEDFGCALPRANSDKLMAAVTIMTTDVFYRSLPEFITLCNVLDGDTYDPQAWDPADPLEIAWAITEVLLIDPPDEDVAEPFALDICAYIGAALAAEGIRNPPDVLRIAKQENAAVPAAEFSDDPLMFAGIEELGQSKSQAITDEVRRRLHRLSSQLRDLPLRSGDAKDAVQRMLQGLTK